MIDWSSVLSSLSNEEFLVLSCQVRKENARRYDSLTDEEKQMDKIPCIKSVRGRLNLSLMDAKIFVEAAYIKMGR